VDQMKAYTELAAELNHYRQLSYEELTRRVGGPIAKRSVDDPEGPLMFVVRFRWAGSEGSAVLISASAYGTSCWKLERLDEEVTVKRPTAAPET
jgi:hypothetical protein